MIRISKKHVVRITRHGSEIVQDTCEICGAVQQIESIGNNDHEKKFRITGNPENEIK